MEDDKKGLCEKAITFIKEVMIAAKNKVVGFTVGMYQHAEMIGILTLSSLGLNALLSELPFMFALPMFIEGALVIPVAAVVIILMLVKNSERRTTKRLAIV